MLCTDHPAYLSGLALVVAQPAHCRQACTLPALPLPVPPPPGPQARLLQLPSVMEVVALLDEPDPELLWMVGCVFV